MNDSLTTIKFHGDLGKSLPRDTWRLAVKTVGEAINAVEQQTKILYKKLIENEHNKGAVKARKIAKDVLDRVKTKIGY